MIDIAIPAGYAALIWWFTTGLILFLDGLPPTTFRRSLAGATVLGVGAAAALCESFDDTTARGAYVGFTAAILIWGWLEMSFLMGFLTGPRKHACVERCSGWRHFLHASEAVIYNEAATLAVGAALGVAGRHASNKVALWTFAILWSMRLSAKLNLFLGVPNLGDKLLPPHLQYLRGFFRRRAMNFLFPLSITGSTIALALLVRRLLAAHEGFETATDALLASFLALAVLEHWFMVLPWPTERMWKWALREELDRSTPPVPNR